LHVADRALGSSLLVLDLVGGLIAMTAAVAWRQTLSLRMSRAQVATDSLTGLANRAGQYDDRPVGRGRAAGRGAGVGGREVLNGTHGGSAIVEAVIRLAQVLNLTTVAEGVETLEQAAELQPLGCDTGQGYLFARPSPATDFTADLKCGRPQRGRSQRGRSQCGRKSISSSAPCQLTTLRAGSVAATT
jgi:hypothetical protein